MPASSPLRSSFALRLPATTALLLLFGARSLPAQTPASSPPVAAAPAPRLFIREFRVQGVTVLDPVEVQKTVAPFLGPGRGEADVDAARAALQKLYQDKGYQAALVEIPPQKPRRGVLVLRVSEGEIARLRVKGSRYNDIDKIKAAAPSLAEGQVPDFNAISRDLVALNRRADRRVTPEILPTETPGALDVTLKVEDKPPVSASAELNDRYSSGTTRLRLNGNVSYDNLWQAGHSIGASVQTSPLDWTEVLVYTGFYTARFDTLPDWSFMVSATRQDTDISTLGGTAVAGRGETYSLRGTRTLPAPPGLFHSFSLGLDLKHYDQAVTTGPATTSTPLTYYPLNALYSGFIEREASSTDYYVGATFHLRGLGSDSAEFDLNRYHADPSFLTLRGDVSQNWKLPAGAGLLARAQGQVASGALVSNEQFAGGGTDTVRGYLEGEALGDHGIFGTLELSSPNLIAAGKQENRLTAHVFADGGFLLLSDALPEQTRDFSLASVGTGFRVHLFRHFDGATFLALPLVDQGETEAGDFRLTFFIRGQL